MHLHYCSDLSIYVIFYNEIFCVTSLKGAIDAKESHKSSSDAMFDETVDLSCGKDIHSITS